MKFRTLAIEHEVVVSGIMIDESLQRSDAQGTILANNRRGDNMPAQGFAHQIGCDFAPMQAGFEIPQGPYAVFRFIHRHVLNIAEGNFDQKRGVTTVGYLSDHRDLTAAQYLFDTRFVVR